VRQNDSLLSGLDSGRMGDLLQEIRHLKESAKERDFLYSLYQEYASISNTGAPSLLVELYLETVTAQSYGPKIEKFHRQLHNYKKVSASFDRGDYKTPEGHYGEHKFSYAHARGGYKYNFVQIRLWQELEFETFEVYCQGRGLFTFRVPHAIASSLIQKYGGLAHGTIETNQNEKKEYALRGTVDDSLWNEMIQYRIQ